MIELALPWGMSYMIPQNGYHPLYAYLLRNPPADVKLNCLDDVKTRQNLKNNPGEIPKLIQRGRDCLKGLPDFFATFFNQSDTYLLELGLAAEIPGDIEFAHTSPVVTGTRPFILHLESFFSLFLPFAGDPNEIVSRSFPLKEQMSRLLESEKCIAIYSHLKQTIQEINSYFDSRIISGKLHHIPIGFEPHAQVKINKPNQNNNIKLLVISSAHQNINNFIDRGGAVVLDVWEEISKKDADAELIWRSPRPPSHIRNQIASVSNRTPDQIDSLFDSINWIDRHLTDGELSHLFDYSDFLLLPSLWLHSTTIFRALSHGCIPIVSDIPQIDEYRHFQNIKVVDGFRAMNWRAVQGIWKPKEHLIHSKEVVSSIVKIINSTPNEREFEKMARASISRLQCDGKSKAKLFYEKIFSSYQPHSNKKHIGYREYVHLLGQGAINGITANAPAPVVIGATEPYCLTTIANDIDADPLLENYSKSNKAKFVFEIANRTHLIENKCWPQYGKDLFSLSAYAGLDDNNVAVVSKGDVIKFISANDSAGYKKISTKRKIENYFRTKNHILNSKINNFDYDIELIEDIGDANLLRVYHLYICYPKALGSFPVVDFILNPRQFSPIIALTKWVAKNNFIENPMDN